MKRTIKTTLLIAIVATTAFFSCTKKNNNTSNSNIPPNYWLIGTWGDAYFELTNEPDTTGWTKTFTAQDLSWFVDSNNNYYGTLPDAWKANGHPIIEIIQTADLFKIKYISSQSGSTTIWADIAYEKRDNNTMARNPSGANNTVIFKRK